MNDIKEIVLNMYLDYSEHYTPKYYLSTDALQAFAVDYAISKAFAMAVVHYGSLVAAERDAMEREMDGEA